MDVCEAVHLARVCQREGGAHRSVRGRKVTIGHAELAVRQDDVRTWSEHEDAEGQGACEDHGRRLAYMVANRPAHNPMEWDGPFPAAPHVSPEIDHRVEKAKSLSCIVRCVFPCRNRMSC